MAASLIGTTVDGYRIVDVIGRGGMGIVYKAVDEALDKTVALKMMAPRLTEDDTFLERFKAEAKALARLDAPGIVRVLALRETQHDLFIVMEHVDGPVLDRVLRRHAPLDWQEALPLIRQMVEAVAHAHDADVLHRDLKPGNILLTQEGTVKITDFGLAKIQASGTDLTSTYETAGTLHYMSPEQIRGMRNVDGRSDLFSLGLIIYEMLTGRLPFDRMASSYAIQRAIVEESFPPLTAFAEDVPDALTAVVDRLLCKNPDDRFPDARAVLDALQPVETQLTSPPEMRAWSLSASPSSRSRSLLIATFALAGLLLLGGAYVTVQWLLQAPTPFSPTADGASPPPRSTLSITSTPTGAVVYLDGDSVGTTPIDTPRPLSTTRIRLTNPDHQPFDTTLKAATGDLTLDISLSSTALPRDASPDLGVQTSEETSSRLGDPPAASPIPDALSPTDTPSTDRPGVAPSSAASATGALAVASSPSGAIVRINGTARGTTPTILTDLEPGQHVIELRTDAYRPFRTTASVPPGDTLRITPTLAPLPATIRLRAVPYGSIAIDGMTRLENSDVALTDSLAPGTYRLRATYRDLSWTHTVTLAPGERYRRVVDFTRTVSVGVTTQTAEGERLSNAEVFVDGEARGYTPLQLTLRVGDHAVTIRKDGYTSVERSITVDDTLAGPLVFQLNRP